MINYLLQIKDNNINNTYFKLVVREDFASSKFYKLKL